MPRHTCSGAEAGGGAGEPKAQSSLVRSAGHTHIGALLQCRQLTRDTSEGPPGVAAAGHPLQSHVLGMRRAESGLRHLQTRDQKAHNSSLASPSSGFVCVFSQFWSLAAGACVPRSYLAARWPLSLRDGFPLILRNFSVHLMTGQGSAGSCT